MKNCKKDCRQRQGQANYQDGLAAEDGIAASYCADGGEIAARRWRGLSGEIDIVVRHGAELIFVEVKKARDFAGAAERITQRQMERIYRAAAEFTDGEPLGSLTPIRFDVALVNDKGERKFLRNVSIA